MTRVLVIDAAGGLWGSERALLDLIDSAPQLDFAVCCPPETPLVRELERRGVRILPYFIERLHEKPRWRRLQAAFGILRACIEFRPEVLHLNQSGVYRVALPAAALFDLPIVAHVRIFEDVPYLARHAPHPRRLKGLIAISAAIEAEIRSFDALQRIPVHTVYDAFVPGPAQAEVVRPAGRIACVGRITPIKGQDLLVDALSRIEASVSECLMVGDGDPRYLDELRARVAGLRPGVVTWCGFMDDVGAVLRRCRALVCPSHREPLGRVIFEAWEAGAVPIVFGGGGGAAEIVAAAEAGIVYAEQTPDCLARAIEGAVTMEDAERERLIANGRRWMARHCAAGPYGRAIGEVLTSAILAGKGAPAPAVA